MWRRTALSHFGLIHVSISNDYDCHDYAQARRYSILIGYRIFHNYFREHEGLEGKTPAGAAGVKVEGENKWQTLIQNAIANSITEN
jgi:hypothetical protein